MTERKKLLDFSNHRTRALFVGSIVGTLVFVGVILLVLFTPVYVWGGLLCLVGLVAGVLGLIYMCVVIMWWIETGDWDWEVF